MALSNELLTRVQTVFSSYDVRKREYESLVAQQDDLGDQLDTIRAEQNLAERSKDVLELVKKSLTKSSLEYCEKLAESAVSSIFGIDAKVKYEALEGKFYLVYPDGNKSDITSDEGGGFKTVISFIFSLYLVIKSGCRRLMFFDEQFMCVSTEYLPNFVGFIRKLCKDLGFDIMLISHDERITLEDVDRAYFVTKGHSRRLK